MGAALVAFMIAVPYFYYRYTFEHSRRLRPIVEGKVYRSGCLTADGFRDAIDRLKIKTIVTLWDEHPDPALPENRFSGTTIKETELCKSLGVDYHFVYVEVTGNWKPGDQRPAAVDKFFKIMDDPKSYPVLFHCKAGLHRTGVMTAVYRMEYEGWSREDAMRELKAHGFGHLTSNASNPYITQYVLHYQPRSMRTSAPPRAVLGTLTSRIEKESE